MDEARRLCRRSRSASSWVALRRMHDAGRLGREEMWSLYRAELGPPPRPHGRRGLLRPAGPDRAPVHPGGAGEHLGGALVVHGRLPTLLGVRRRRVRCRGSAKWSRRARCPTCSTRTSSSSEETSRTGSTSARVSGEWLIRESATRRTVYSIEQVGDELIAGNDRLFHLGAGFKDAPCFRPASRAWFRGSARAWGRGRGTSLPRRASSSRSRTTSSSPRPWSTRAS